MTTFKGFMVPELALCDVSAALCRYHTEETGQPVGKEAE